jgi:hypothetical protein
LYKILPVTRRSPCSRRRPDSALRKVVLPAPGGARTRVKRPGRSTPEAPSTIFRGCWETVPSADLTTFFTVRMTVGICLSPTDAMVSTLRSS